MRARGTRAAAAVARLRSSCGKPREPRISRRHRVGRGTQVVERQGRAQRHLVIRHEQWQGRLPQAQALWRTCASGRDARISTARSALPAGIFRWYVRRMVRTCRSRPCSTSVRQEGPAQQHERRRGRPPRLTGEELGATASFRQGRVRARARRRVLEGDEPRNLGSPGKVEAPRYRRPLGGRDAPARQLRGPHQSA